MEHRRTVRIVNSQGLHARPCHALAARALEFGADVELRLRGRVANGKSILALMGPAGCEGDELEVVARGEDAPEAVEALCGLVETGFGEA